MSRGRRAIVIGGSMSGLLAAIMLRRRGWEVDVFERVERELSDRGAGIVAQAELIARLNALGLKTQDLGVAMNTRKILDQSGAVTIRLECPQVLTAWQRVYRVLRDAFPAERYHRGCGLKAFEQSGDGVVAHLREAIQLRPDWPNAQAALASVIASSPAATPDELHDALLTLGFVTVEAPDIDHADFGKALQLRARPAACRRRADFEHRPQLVENRQYEFAGGPEKAL